MRVSAVQMTSTLDIDRNLRTAQRLMDEAALDGAKLIALPELFNRWGSAQDLRDGAEPLDGPTVTWARDRAAHLGVWLVAGSIIELVEESDRHFDTACLISPTGEITAVYRKMHLFQVDVEGTKHDEPSLLLSGDEIVVAEVGELTIGMSICFDLRFPELFRIQALRGATVAVVPSAFTAVTGRDHWETLLRARAIENQMFVIAPNQIGSSSPELSWHGHSSIIDAWGTVLAQAPDEECVITADLNLDTQRETRERLPTLSNRRSNNYQWPDAQVENEGV
ncbi:MAG: carbon-nitrogen hydrolase family protein [Acidimicrobiia bacterium]|nr:carbon-nitrogen hydrolase family protein [Acidimicrobiia bacterium]